MPTTARPAIRASRSCRVSVQRLLHRGIMLRHALHIAFVAPREPCPMVDDLAAGLAARGHRVRMHGAEEGYDKVFRRLHAERPDVVSQHASAPEAFALAEGLPVIHT